MAANSAKRKRAHQAIQGPEASELFDRARRHLARRDPVMKRLIAEVGPCTLWHDSNHFAVLARSIIAQQISTKAAASIGRKLHAALAPHGITPRGVLGASVEVLRGAGLSAGKVRSLCDLAEKVHGGEVPLDRMAELSDEEVIERLVPVYGIGRWTAEMFLIFSLGRLDVLPVADRGLRVGAQLQYGLAEPPNRARLEELALPWRPYRSVATWYFWRSFGGVPQS
jgi:DNA-3-methyladenine glycosylase II